MNKPNKNNTWETFIPIKQGQEPLQVLKNEVYDTIMRLSRHHLIWYCILIHRGKDFIDKEDENIYYHIRFSTEKKLQQTGEKSFKYKDGRSKYLEFGLDKFCMHTRKMGWNQLGRIVGINSEVIIDKDIMHVWEFIGKQSEIIMEFIAMHDRRADIQTMQRNLVQILHYFSNMTGFEFAIKIPTEVTYLI